jgi:hypothetical protein
VELTGSKQPSKKGRATMTAGDCVAEGANTRLSKGQGFLVGWSSLDLRTVQRGWETTSAVDRNGIRQLLVFVLGRGGHTESLCLQGEKDDDDAV